MQKIFTYIFFIFKLLFPGWVTSLDQYARRRGTLWELEWSVLHVYDIISSHGSDIITSLISIVGTLVIGQYSGYWAKLCGKIALKP